EAEADEVKKDAERRSGVGSHHHCRAELHFARARRFRIVESALPFASELDAESPSGWKVILTNGRFFVAGRLGSMWIQRCGARLQPDVRRILRNGDGFADDARGEHARLDYLLLIRRAVAAVDVPSGQIDDDVGAVDLPCPGIEVDAVPPHGAPRPHGALPAEHDHLMLRIKGAGQKSAEMS